jgi:hypothetical protein
MNDGKNDSHDTSQVVLQVNTGLKSMWVNAFCRGNGLKREGESVLQIACPA